MSQAPTTPSVTIIVCCYNATVTLADTLESLQAQTHPALEILVVNDASTDDTAGMVARYQASDPRIKMVTHDTNMGLAHGRKTGVENAAHDLLTFIDADDIAMPNMVERLVAALLEDETRLGVSSYRIYFDDERDLGVQKIGPTSRAEYMKLYEGQKLVFLSYPNLVRRQDVLAVGGYRVDVMPTPEGIRYEDFCEDLDMWDVGPERGWSLFHHPQGAAVALSQACGFHVHEKPHPHAEQDALDQGLPAAPPRRSARARLW